MVTWLILVHHCMFLIKTTGKRTRQNFRWKDFLDNNTQATISVIWLAPNTSIYLKQCRKVKLPALVLHARAVLLAFEKFTRAYVFQNCTKNHVITGTYKYFQSRVNSVRISRNGMGLRKVLEELCFSFESSKMFLQFDWNCPGPGLDSRTYFLSMGQLNVIITFEPQSVHDSGVQHNHQCQWHNCLKD